MLVFVVFDLVFLPCDNNFVLKMNVKLQLTNTLRKKSVHQWLVTYHDGIFVKGHPTEY